MRCNAHSFKKSFIHDVPRKQRPGRACRSRSSRASRLSRCHAAAADIAYAQVTPFPEKTKVTSSDDMVHDMNALFEAADLNQDGTINRAEFGRLAESLGKGSEYVMFHWMDDDTIDDLYAKYAGDSGQITFSAFQSLAEDGVLLEGRLSEYLQLFESCPSYERSEAPGDFGSIDRTDVASLSGRLEHPLTQEEAEQALQTFCQGRVCSLDDQRIPFSDFLSMFRDKLLDLQQITEYMKLEDVPQPSYSPDQVEEAQSVAPEAHNGIFTIESSEQFDALLTLNAEREVVLVAGLSWCRPCRSLTRPMEKLATHYHDGAVFAKVLGDVNDNTKRFFKDRLKVKATPQISVFCRGVRAHMRTGANKSKIKDGVRRFYNTDLYRLPSKSIYPLIQKRKCASVA